MYLSETESELLSYDYFVGGNRRGQDIELRFSSASVGVRFSNEHDVQEILEWARGKRLSGSGVRLYLSRKKFEHI